MELSDFTTYTRTVDQAAPTPSVNSADDHINTMHLRVVFDYTHNRRPTVRSHSHVTIVWTDPDLNGLAKIEMAFKAPNDQWNRRLGRHIALGRLRKGGIQVRVDSALRSTADIEYLLNTLSPSRWANIKVVSD